MAEENKVESKQELSEEELKKIAGGKRAGSRGSGVYSSNSGGIPYSQATQNSMNNAQNNSGNNS